MQYENSIPTTNSATTVLANKSFQIKSPHENKECRHGGHIILQELLVSEDNADNVASDAAKGPGELPAQAVVPHERRKKRDVGDLTRVNTQNQAPKCLSSADVVISRIEYA